MAAPAAGQQLTYHELAQDSSPAHVASGPDGAVWFTEQGLGRIGRLTVGGVQGSFPIPRPAAAPGAIAAGADAVYYTDSRGGMIGRVALDGAIEEVSVQTCPVPLCGLRLPGDLATAPDGSVWFSVDVLFASGARDEDAYHEICSVGPRLQAGECTRIDDVGIPSGHATGGPTLGPDGGMWFTNKYENVVGRVAIGGAREVRKLALGSQRDPEAIVAGPDGALWFAETTLNTIGRITTAGAASQYLLPRENSGPFGIAAGPDEAVWFTEGSEAGNAIGRVQPDGTITEYPLPHPASGPLGITTGPDGAIWFAERATDRIGRLAVRARATSPAAGAPAPAVAPAAPAPLVLATRVRPRTLTAGRTRRHLVVTVRLSRLARVALRLQRASRGRPVVARRPAQRLAAGTRSLRLRLPERGLRSGSHQIVVEASEGTRLTSRTTLPLNVRP
jgi:virginiamycin B lyase